MHPTIDSPIGAHRSIHNKPLTPLRVVSLGALNGLLAGLVLEKVRLTFLNYQMSEAAREYAQTNLIADFVEARWEPFVPLASIAIFAVVGYLIYEYFMNHRQLLLTMWLSLGGVAVALGYFMSTAYRDVSSFVWLCSSVAVCFLVYWLWKKHRDSLTLFWLVNGVSAVIVVALAVQLVGLFFLLAGPEKSIALVTLPGRRTCN